MTTTGWTSNERRVIVGALYTAIEKYRDCAKEIGGSDMSEVARDRLVATFKKQADECSELLEKLD
jgi:hypothetical protein